MQSVPACTRTVYRYVPVDLADEHAPVNILCVLRPGLRQTHQAEAEAVTCQADTEAVLPCTLTTHTHTHLQLSTLY